MSYEKSTMSLFDQLFYGMIQDSNFIRQLMIERPKNKGPVDNDRMAGVTFTLTVFFLNTCICVCVSPASGQLVDFIKRVEQRAPLSCDTVLKILYQTCRAVQHMHKQKPPIIHRDLKVHINLLDK